MVSTRAKGSKKEKEVADLFSWAEFAVSRAPLTAKFIGPGRVVSIAADFFGAFDLLAKRRGDPTVWCQVTFENHAAKRKAKIIEFAREYLSIEGDPTTGGPFDRALLFLWIPRKHFRVFELIYDPTLPPTRSHWDWIEIGKVDHGVAINSGRSGPSLTYLLSPGAR